jgi:hypothetical protein
MLKSQILENIIKKHKRFKSLKHLLILPDRFTTSQFRRLSKKSYGYSATWLKEREAEGLIKRNGKENGQNIWDMKDSARNLINILNKI